jgi:hypothetical protein
MTILINSKKMKTSGKRLIYLIKYWSEKQKEKKISLN